MAVKGVGGLGATRNHQGREGGGEETTAATVRTTSTKAEPGLRSAATAAASTCTRQCVRGPTPADGACWPAAAAVEAPPPLQNGRNAGESRLGLADSRKVQSATVRCGRRAGRRHGGGRQLRAVSHPPSTTTAVHKKPPLRPKALFTYSTIAQWRG